MQNLHDTKKITSLPTRDENTTSRAMVSIEKSNRKKENMDQLIDHHLAYLTQANNSNPVQN